MKNGLIEIGKHHNTPKSPNLVFPFFVAGVIFGLLGIGYIGLHLWLMLNGRIALRATYTSWKELHAIIQFYLFLGLFILGFIFQAGPRLMNVDARPSRYLNLLILPLIIGVGFIWQRPELVFGKWILFLSLCVPALFVLLLIKRAILADTIQIGCFLLLGVTALSLGAFFELTVPFYALLLFWYGIVPIFFATGQQFISGFLGGKRMGVFAATIILCLYLFSLLAFYLEYREVIQPQLTWHIFQFSALTIFLIFAYSTKLWRVYTTWPCKPLGLAFGSGFLWLLIGILSLNKGILEADFTLHIWSLGLAIPILFSTTAQLVEFLTKERVLSEGSMSVLLLVWQVVPIGRGLPASLHLSTEFSWLVATIVGVVFLIWGYRLVVPIFRSVHGSN